MPTTVHIRAASIWVILRRGALVALWLAACIAFILRVSPELWVTDLADIQTSGEITVITRNNAHCYYHYRGEPMGFEYDLARELAADLGVRLRVEITDTWEGMIPAVLAARGRAFIAASFTRTEALARQVAFSKPYLTVRPHLILRRNDQRIRRVSDLDGRTVHVQRGTAYQDRLAALRRGGIDVQVVLHEDAPTEELIRRVAEGTIEMTVANSHVAKLNRRYYPATRIGPALGPAEPMVWAVHPHAHELLARIDNLFDRLKREGRIEQIYDRHFTALDEFDYVDLRAFHRRIESRLPRYEQYIRKAAGEYDLDWRLIAAQVYQESHWNPRAQSHAGAYGLMQLTEATAHSLGVGQILDPAENIRAGVRHLKNLYDFFDRARGRDRIYLALAAYNIGQGHLLDARNLARQLGLDPDRWRSVTRTLPLLSHRQHYRNSLYGYARGTEPIAYVRQILVYYDILKRRGIKYQLAGKASAEEETQSRLK